MSISILVVDDHAVIRKGIRCMLSGSDIEVVAEADNGKAGISMAQQHTPDVVLLDIRMPDSDGIETLEDLSELMPEPRVIIFSTYENPTYVARAVVLGAKDYILKGTSRMKLIERIRRVANDEPAGDDSLMYQVRRSMALRKSASTPVSLTNRETQVLRHIAFGLSNREISRSLDISVETVKEHVQNIIRKIDVVDRTHAAVWALKAGLVG